jgi:hypothetical protein
MLAAREEQRRGPPHPHLAAREGDTVAALLLKCRQLTLLREVRARRAAPMLLRLSRPPACTPVRALQQRMREQRAGPR